MDLLVHRGPARLRVECFRNGTLATIAVTIRFPLRLC